MNNIFNVKDTDESLQGKSGGRRFGLNTGNVTNIAFVEEEKDGKTFRAVDIVVVIEDSEMKSRHFLNEGVYGKNNQILMPGDEGYEERYYEHYSAVVGVLKHALKSVKITDQVIDSALAGLTSSQLLEGMKRLTSLFTPQHATLPVDIFLEYQWKISEGQDRTYVTLPKNMKGSAFLIPAVTPNGKWTAVESESGLTYVDNAGNVHPFKRTASFMESPKGQVQELGGNPTPAQGAPANPITDAAKSSWG